MLDILFGFFFDFLFFLPFLMQRKKETRLEWSGIVEEKKARVSHFLSKYAYTVIFRTDDGERKKLRMGKDDFNLYREGVRYIKKPGSYLPDSSQAG
ncbi:MAG: hypothetical protein MUQ25_09475 [Candidatus Aminicenantes bacterium]|nr:hypothetical protein [Candidatus Aminicenantes bacterium]